MSNPEPDLDVADMTEILLDRLAKQASAEIMDCARLGRVIMNLRRDLDAEQPKGTYGIGKIFKAGFGQVGAARGRTGTDAEIEKVTNVLLDRFINKIYELAEVDR